MTYLAGRYDNLFGSTGALNNTVDHDDSIPLSSQAWAFAHDFGTVGTSETTTPVVYAIGHERDPLVQLSNVPNINGTRHPYYFTRYGDVLGMVCTLTPPCVPVLTCLLAGRRTPRRLPQYLGTRGRVRQEPDL